MSNVIERKAGSSFTMTMRPRLLSVLLLAQQSVRSIHILAGDDLKLFVSQKFVFAWLVSTESVFLPKTINDPFDFCAFINCYKQ